MEQILAQAFSVLNQGVAALNAAKAAETGTVATTMQPINPVQLSPEQRAAQAAQAASKKTMWIVGGLAVAAAIFFFMRKKR